MADETAWNAALQVEAWAGELRVNVIRAISITAFYGQHLVSYHLLGDDLGEPYHLAVTAITVAWVAVGMALHLCLRSRYRPSWLSHAAVAADLFMVTLLLMVSDGPRSILLVLYLLVLATTAVRLDLTLVRVATLLAAIGYGAVLVHSYEYQPDWVVPRRQQVIFTLALGCAGLLAGQSVRRARRLAHDYHDRVLFLRGQTGEAGGGQA